MSPLGYHLLHRAGRQGWWWPVFGLAVVVVGFLGIWPVLVQLLFLIGYAVAGQDPVAAVKRLLDVQDPTPATLAYINVVLGSTILLTWLVTRVFHGLKPGWLSSVRPRIRWTYFFACLAVSVLALIATLVVSAVVGAIAPSSDQGVGSDGVNDFTATTRDFLLVILLLTPFQAAGEEYVFRGYLTQAFGGITGSKAIAVVGPALLFALAHGAQDPPVFVDRFAFGLVAGILVISTGGLEAGIAMHVLNNFFAYGLALAYTDMGSALNPTGGSWWSLPGTLTQSLVYLALATFLARRMGLATAADPAVLEASRGTVYRVPPVAGR